MLIQIANANDKHIIGQYAGDIGKYSFGVGQQITSWYSLSLHYGQVEGNKFHNKIETYTLKNNFHLFKYNRSHYQYRLLTGLSLLHIPGRKYETDEVSGASSNYYRQSSYRAIVYLTHEFVYKNLYSMYFESGVNDIWLTNSYNNDSINIRDHVSLGIGFRYWFR